MHNVKFGYEDDGEIFYIHLTVDDFDDLVNDLRMMDYSYEKVRCICTGPNDRQMSTIASLDYIPDEGKFGPFCQDLEYLDGEVIFRDREKWYYAKNGRRQDLSEVQTKQDEITEHLKSWINEVIIDANDMDKKIKELRKLSHISLTFEIATKEGIVKKYGRDFCDNCYPFVINDCKVVKSSLDSFFVNVSGYHLGDQKGKDLFSIPEIEYQSIDKDRLETSNTIVPYYIHTLGERILVFYTDYNDLNARRYPKEFNSLEDAKEWISEVHYPAQIAKFLVKR